MKLKPAIKVSCDIFSGNNHGECLKKLKENSTQGFVTDQGVFLSRESAAMVALSYNIVKDEAIKKVKEDMFLQSEHLKESEGE